MTRNWHPREGEDLAAYSGRIVPLIRSVKGAIHHFDIPKLERWIETSKDDCVVFVGSDIRMLAGDLHRVLTALSHDSGQGNDTLKGTDHDG